MSRSAKRIALARKLGISPDGLSLKALEAMTSGKGKTSKTKTKSPVQYGTHGGYSREEVSEIMAYYPTTGAKAHVAGKGVVPKGAKRVAPSSSWKLQDPVFNEQVVLKFGALAPHATSPVARKAGWDRPGGKRPAAGKPDWLVKYVPFTGNVAQLHQEIRKAMRESGDFHHIAFELLERKGTLKGFSVYEVILGS